MGDVFFTSVLQMYSCLLCFLSLASQETPPFFRPDPPPPPLGTRVFFDFSQRPPSKKLRGGPILSLKRASELLTQLSPYIIDVGGPMVPTRGRWVRRIGPFGGYVGFRGSQNLSGRNLIFQFWQDKSSDRSETPSKFVPDRVGRTGARTEGSKK